MPDHRDRPPVRRVGTVIGILALSWIIIAAPGGGAALGAGTDDATLDISVELAPALSIDTETGCASGVPNVTTFPAMIPEAAESLEPGCTVTFGARNDTAALELYQEDRYGAAMYRLPHGELDTDDGDGDDFSIDGRDTINFGGASFFEKAAMQRLGANAGKVIAVGRASPGAPGTHIALARYGLDGEPDPTLAGGTGTIVDVGDANQWSANSVTVDAQDRIVVAGARRIGSNAGALIRYTADGIPDDEFSDDGYLTSAGTDRTFWDVVVQPDGKVLAVGQTNLAPNIDIVLARYNDDGSPDTSFNDGVGGNNDVVLDIAGGNDIAKAVHLRDDGRIVIAGQGTTGGSLKLSVAQFTSGGAPDNGFSPGGWKVHNIDSSNAPDEAWDMDLLPDGDIVVAGETGVTGSNGDDWVVARLDGADGDIEWVDVIDEAGANDSARGIEVDPIGNIVVAGFLTVGGSPLTAVARYLEDGTPDSTFGGSGFATDNDPNVRHARDVLIAADGKYVTVGGPDANIASATRWETLRVAQYSDDALDASGNDWGTPGAGHFGACLVSMQNTTLDIDTWDLDANDASDCDDGDDDPWYAVAPASGGATALVARTDGLGQDQAEVTISFGLRADATQAPGIYIAPLIFESIAAGV